jgi:hypothetical protein
MKGDGTMTAKLAPFAAPLKNSWMSTSCAAAGSTPLSDHFTEEEQVKPTLMINVINGWNRLAVGYNLWVYPVATVALYDSSAAAALALSMFVQVLALIPLSLRRSSGQLPKRKRFQSVIYPRGQNV